jgi:hypothetical protein
MLNFQRSGTDLAAATVPECRGERRHGRAPAASLIVKFAGDRDTPSPASSLGQPRQIRARRDPASRSPAEMPSLPSCGCSGPERSNPLKSHGVGYIDLSGNRHLALENILIEGGQRNIRRPPARSGRSLPRASGSVFLSETGRVGAGQSRGDQPGPCAQRRSAWRSWPG